MKRNSKSNSRSNINQNKKNHQANKKYLASKISDAMKMKYSKVFTEANYDDKNLQSDIEKLITTQYSAWNPKDLFNPIETEVLEKIKQKNPKIKIQVPKARKLAPIKYQYDKYQEADKAEQENLENKENKETKKEEKKDEKKEEKNLNKINKIKQINQKQNKSNIKKNDTPSRKSKSTTKSNLSYIIIKPYYQNIKPSIQKENDVHHELVDRLNYIREHDFGNELVAEDKRLLEKEKEEEKAIKINKKNQLLKLINAQKEENDKKKENARLQKIKDRKEIDELTKKENEEYQNEQKTKKEYQQNIRNLMEQNIIEQNKLNKERITKEKEEEKKIVDAMKFEPTYEQKIYLERKKKIQDEVMKDMKERENNKKSKSFLNDNNENYEFINSSKNSEFINERVLKRQKEQERAGEYLKKIQSVNGLLKDGINGNNSIDFEKQKQLEYEEADKKRINFLNQMKKSFDEYKIYKDVQKRKERIENIKLRNEEKERYDKYLLEEKDRKKKQFEKYEKYRKELEDQIKANKQRELESLVRK